MRQNAQRVHDQTKLGIHTNGPYKVRQVQVNGNITIQLRPGVTERINIQGVIPYRDENDHERIT